jgi:predicted solute-binding protein
MNNVSKSPLKNKPLRVPGQSLDEEIKNFIDDKLFKYLLFPLLLVVFSVYDWLLWYQVVKLPNPLLFSVITIGLSVYSFFKLKKEIKKAKALKLGRDGERAVGQTLEALRKKGYRIFHDLLEHLSIS